jgi:hypothetical protein
MLAETELFDEKQQLFDLMFQKLGDKCKVLQLSFLYNLWKKWPKKLKPMVMSARKNPCVQDLTQWIQETNRFKSLKN